MKRENIFAFELREDIIKKFGAPASSIRPEGNVTWVVFGVVAALSFILLGWHHWSVVQPSSTATILIVLNILTILTSMLVLHLGFFGRILTIYKRNKLRVVHLSHVLSTLDDSQIDAWWNCRNFVLNDDLALDYDIGGLAVSLTFIINLAVVIVVVIQIWREGFKAILEPPGSYCAYAGLYITCCMIRIFNFATSTFEEQYRHVHLLQRLSAKIMSHSNSFSNLQGLDHNYFHHYSSTYNREAYGASYNDSWSEWEHAEYNEYQGAYGVSGSINSKTGRSGGHKSYSIGLDLEGDNSVGDEGIQSVTIK